MTMIKSEKLKYRYEHSEALALDDININIEQGEFIAILGHNGSGKSTLAKLFNGLLLPVEGTLWVDAMSTHDQEMIWQIRKSVGMVFQNPDNQIIATIVEEDIAFGPENIGLPREEIINRVDFALERVGMIPFKKKPPHMLSGGQKQRISIAGVLAMKPKCIVFDEATAMLDPVGRKEVMDTIISLHREGITVILITHFMEEAILAERILVMDQGKIVKDEVPSILFKDVEALLALSLDVPEAVKVAHALNKSGIILNEDILTREQLVKAICQYISNQ